MVIVNVSNEQKVVKGINLEGTYFDLFNEGENYKFVGYDNVILIYPRGFKVLIKSNK